MLAYVEGELIAREMNPFDAALALMALAHLGADVSTFAPALHCIVGHLGEGGRHGPYKAYEWNKMKTPTRILVGGPEVTSAFVLMGLALARRAMMAKCSVNCRVGEASSVPTSFATELDSVGYVRYSPCAPYDSLPQ